MKQNLVKHKDRTAHYAPVYSPAHIEVLLDEGVREIKGNIYRCRIERVESIDGMLRIIVSK